MITLIIKDNEDNDVITKFEGRMVFAVVFNDTVSKDELSMNSIVMGTGNIARDIPIVGAAIAETIKSSIQNPFLQYKTAREVAMKVLKAMAGEDESLKKADIVKNEFREAKE